MRYFIVVILFVGIVFSAYQSERIRIIHADRNIGRKVGEEQLRVLIGNVHVQKDTIHIFCDSAKYYEAFDRLDLFGNVEVDDGNKVLKARRMQYFTNDEILEAQNQVRIRGPEDSLYAERVRYNLKIDEASAWINVFMLNEANRVRITGDNAYYSNRDSLFEATGNARFSQFYQDSPDTFNVWAAKIVYRRVAGGIATAYDSVKITHDAMIAKADTAYFYKARETAKLRGKPRVWIEDSRLTGTKIDAHFDSSEVRYIYVQGNAEAISKVDSLSDKRNRLRGKEIEFFISDRKPVKIISRHNASSIYFLQESDEKGSNYSTADSIFIFFAAGELDSIQVIGGARGVFYPEAYKGERNFGEQ